MEYTTIEGLRYYASPNGSTFWTREEAEVDILRISRQHIRAAPVAASDGALHQEAIQAEAAALPSETHEAAAANAESEGPYALERPIFPEAATPSDVLAAEPASVGSSNPPASSELGQGLSLQFDMAAAKANLSELHRLCCEQDSAATTSDAADLAARVHALKSQMMSAVRRSHSLQSEMQELERLIALHIRHRMEVEDKRRAPPASKLSSEVVRFGPDDKSRYELLVYLVRVNPWWLAKLVGEVGHEVRPQLIHLILNVLYADMHDDEDDALLLNLIGDALESETAKSNDQGSYMRDNTTLTKLMDKYMQRDPGREALVRTLAAPVGALLGRGAEYSLDATPLAVSADLIEAGGRASAAGPGDDEGVAAGPSPDEIAAQVAARHAESTRVAGEFLDAITSAAAIEALPYGTRWIAKRIFELAKRKFARGGGAARDGALDGVYSLLGGFIFLRYINPRIVAPETIELCASAPTKRMRRNLTIVAKMLQSLSNNVVGETGKESDMWTAFVTANTARLRAYFDALIDVPELSLRELKLEKYLHTLRAHQAHRLIAISTSELHTLHRLALGHAGYAIHERAREALDALPTPPEGKVVKDEDTEYALSMSPTVALTYEEEASSMASSSRRRSTGAPPPPSDPAAMVGAKGARQTLRMLLSVLPEHPPLSESLPESLPEGGLAACTATEAWEAATSELTARAVAVAESRHAAEALHELYASGYGEGERAWALVTAALEESHGMRYLGAQEARYSSSLERLAAASASLEGNIGMYTHTLEAVRPAEGEGLPDKYVCTTEKLQRKGVLPSEAPAIEGVEAKIVAKYWPRASFTFELKAGGEIHVAAAVKGRVMWDGSLRLDELLKQRAEGVDAIEVDGVDIHLQPVLTLIDQKFYQRNKRR